MRLTSRPALVLSFVAAAALIVVVLSMIFASEGVVKNDPERNIFIPDDLTMELRVKAAYNDEEMFWRFEWDAPEGSFFHDFVVYEDGEWVRFGRSPVGPEPYGSYEDRLSFFVDDGSVEYFREYGGFITVVSQARFMTDEAGEEEAQQYLGRDDVRKFLPETREDPADWRTVRPEEELAALEEAGYFLDLWHWRAYRSNPVGFSDDERVSWYRLGDEGDSPFTDNWDEDNGQPAFMFNPELTGQYAMSWERVLARDYTQDDFYYLSEEVAVPFDPEHQWQNGDALPRRFLREPTESRGDILGNGVWEDGVWSLDLVRALETGNPDDKVLRDLGQYDVAFAVHRNSTGSRWHYVSYPYGLGLGRGADIEALRFSGAQPPWDEIDWLEIKLFYPGQISWDHVFSRAHAGFDGVKDKEPLRSAHSEEDLSRYAVESEFRSEIRRQWLWTTGAWGFFFLAASWAVIRASGALRANGRKD